MDVLRVDVVESIAGGVDDFGEGSWALGPNELFELREDHFDRIEVGAIRWEQHNLCTGRFNRQSSPLGFVAGEIVHHNQVAGLQCGSQKRFAESNETNTVHRTVEYHCRTCSIQCDRMHKRVGLPATCRYRLNKTLTTEGPTPQTSQIRLQAGFIEKHEPFRVYIRLTLEPVSAFENDVFSILFCRPL